MTYIAANLFPLLHIADHNDRVTEWSFDSQSTVCPSSLSPIEGINTRLTGTINRIDEVINTSDHNPSFASCIVGAFKMSCKPCLAFISSFTRCLAYPNNTLFTGAVRIVPSLYITNKFDVRPLRWLVN